MQLRARLNALLSATAVAGAVAVLAVGAVGTVPAPTADAAGANYKIDFVHSTVLFRVKHMNTSWAYGRFNEFSGTVTLDDANMAASSIQIEVNATSVDTANNNRDDHLRSPDFLNCAQFPKMTFKSTSVKKVDDTHFDVTGDMTLHGTTLPVTLRVEKTGSSVDRDKKPIVGFEATGVIQRSKFGMGGHLEGLGDDITLTISIEAAKG